MIEAPGLFHKQPMGGAGAPPWCVWGARYTRGLLYFFSGKKVTKNLVALKTRFDISAFV